MTRFRDDPRSATAILAVASVLSIIVTLWLGRGTTFSGDEASWVVATSGIDLTTIFQPQGGHLLALTRLVYWPILEFNGLGYLPFRVLAIGANLLTVWLLYAYGRRRTDHFVALAPCFVLLFFGTDFLHVFQGNGFTVMLSVALGIGALLSLEREDRRGDVMACLCLTLGIFSYTVILAFVAAAGIFVLLGSDRWKRIWVVLVPVAIYGAWRVWVLLADVSSNGGGIEFANILLVPAWGFQSLSAILNALTGLSYAFSGQNLTGEAGLFGPPLALAFVGLIAWCVNRRGVGKSLVAGLVALTSLVTLQALPRQPSSGYRSIRDICFRALRWSSSSVSSSQGPGVRLTRRSWRSPWWQWPESGPTSP